MQLLRLETELFLAWVSPLAGGLADFSYRPAGSAPVALLRRSPPELDSPSWLALRPRFKAPLGGSERSFWSLLDRTPVSARLRHESGDGARCTARYELTPTGLLVEFEAELAESVSLDGAVLINGVRAGVEIEPQIGLGRVLLHDRRDAKYPIGGAPSSKHLFALAIVPGPEAMQNT